MFAYNGESVAKVYCLPPTVAAPPWTPNVVAIPRFSSDFNDGQEIPFAISFVYEINISNYQSYIVFM